nr:pyridoxal phosphate-dependent aminotransferase [Bradyrhizobium canariense]
MREAITAANVRTNRSTNSIGLTSLRRVVAERLSVKTGTRWGTEDVVISANPKQALGEAALAVLSQGDEAIIICPCSPAIPGQVLLAGATPVFVDARRPRYVPDAGAIRAAVTPRTRAIVINSPNNPTGAVYDRATLGRIADLALEAGLWIISEESYSSFIFTGARRHESIVMAHPSVCSRTIVVNPLSTAESEAKRPPIPTEGGQRFRSKTASQSERRRPPC